MVLPGPQSGMVMSDESSVDNQIGKYRLVAQIGHGGMGDVYLAMAKGPSGFTKLVVVKARRMAPEDGEHLRSMFLDEGRLAARLNHENVVQTYEVGEANGAPYIAMEVLGGAATLEARPCVRTLRPAPGSRYCVERIVRASLCTRTARLRRHSASARSSRPEPSEHLRDVRRRRQTRGLRNCQCMRFSSIPCSHRCPRGA